VTIIDTMQDPQLFGRFFDPMDPWSTWIVILKALFALPMTNEEVELFGQLSGGRTPPQAAGREAWLVIGRRGGKSRIAALIVVFLAFFREYQQVLAPGERGTIMVIAADRRQARVVFGYIWGFVESVPMLAQEVEARTRESITLRSGISIEVHTASFRAVRGYTIVAAVLDEVAFWRSDDSANPDVEIVAALRPAMATVPGALLLGISSPYARRGVLWNAYQKHYGKEPTRA
jgi:phage terminase large subunit-like protein